MAKSRKQQNIANVTTVSSSTLLAPLWDKKLLLPFDEFEKWQETGQNKILYKRIRLECF